MILKKYLKFIAAFFIMAAFYSPASVFGQCTIDDTCAGPYANVVIGEVSGDSAQSDACNDAIVEIIGPPGTNIGCMVLTDTEWAVLIPPGTVIPADGVFLVACSEDLTASCGVGINGSSNGIACAECDFPDLDGAGAAADGSVTNGEIDLDVCDPDAVTFYDPAASGFTLDNQGQQGNNGDGEQVFLFLPDGTPWDGIIWDGGGTGAADHTTISSGGTYTLGDNDGNGVINDNAGTVGGGRGDGGNATAVPILPTDDGCPCNTSAAPGTFTVPAYTPGSTTDLWYEFTTSDHVGCNSSFIRGPLAGMGFGGSPSHTDGLITSTGTDALGQPIDNGGGLASGTTGDAFDPSSFTNTACNPDPSAEWGYTDHPTPGQPNNDPTWVFYADNTVLCDLNTPITFTAEIYNYQHVSDNTDIFSGEDNVQTGSYVFDPITGTNVIWDTYTVSGETTTMTYTVPAGTFTAGGIYSFGVVWDDYSNCCGTTGDPHTQGTPNECYEETVFIIEVVEPLMATQLTIDCDAGDSPAGAVDVSQFITGGSDLMYELFDISGGSPGTSIVGPQSSGVFLLNTSATMGDYEVVVTDGSGCSAPVTITILDNCEQPPVCPENFAVTIDGAAGPVTACPGGTVDLCFDGDQLPPGGTITWEFTSDGGTTYTAIESFPIPEPIPVVEGYISQFTYDPGTVPADCSDGQPWGGTDNAPEVVELVVTPLSDLSCHVLSDGEGAYVIPPGTIAPSDGVIVICGDPCVAAAVPGGCDLIATSADMAGGNFVLGNTGDQLIFMAPDGTILDEVAYDSGDDCIAQTVPPTNTVAGCGGNIATGVTTAGPSPCAVDLANTGLVLTADGSDFVDNGSDYGGFGTADGPGLSPSSGGGGYNSTPADMEFCTTFTIPDDACPTATYDFQAVVDPFDSANCPVEAPDEADPISVPLQATVSCPDAVLTPAIFDVCQADANTVDIPVTITGGAGPFTLTYTDGTNNTTLSAFASGDMITITGPTTGEIKISLVSIVDEGGAMCPGSVNSDEVCVNIRPEPTATLSTSSSPTACTPCDGSITFDYGASTLSAGPFDIEYSVNGTPQLVAGVTLPYTVTGLCPGTYDIISILDDASCAGTVTPNEVTLTAPSGTPLSVTAQPAAVCGDGTATIDLSTDATFSPAYTAADFNLYTVDPNSLPASALTNTPPLLTSTTVTVTAATTYYAQYTDPVTGCVTIAPIDVTVDNALCAACSISAATITPSICMDNGTPGDPSDDTFTFTISDVTQDDATFTNGFTFDGTPFGLTATEAGTYGAGTNYTSPAINISTVSAGSPYTITIADADDPDCTFDLVLTVPATCSNCTDIVVDASTTCLNGLYTVVVSSITGGDVTGGNDFTVTGTAPDGTVLGPATYSGVTITFPNLSYSGGDQGIVTLTITDADNNSCTTTHNVFELNCVANEVCDCANYPNSLTINAQATGNANGYQMVYVLLDVTGNTITVNQSGTFPGLLGDNSAYEVHAFNVEDADVAAFIAAMTSATTLADAIATTPAAPFDALCYTTEMAAFQEDCGCVGCPTVTTPASGTQNFCDTATPDFADATTGFVGGIPSGNSTATLMWYCDQAPDANTAPATPYDVSCLNAPADNCSPATTTLYAYYVCDLDGNAATTTDLTYLDAGSIDIVIFPTPTAAEVTEGPGCLLTATPNCPGGATGSLTIWYPSTPGGTDYAAGNAPPAANDGDTYNYIAFVTGAEATTPPIAPAACGFEGTVTAICNGCPTIGTPASGVQNFCGAPAPDFSDATTGFAEGIPATGGATATLMWYCDQAPDANTAPTTPYSAACLNAPGDNCSSASTTIYAYYVCDEDGNANTTNDITYLTAGAITVVDYATPTLAEVTEDPGCLLTVSPNCPGGSTGITIWYPSTPTGTDYAAGNTPGTPTDGATYNYIAFVTGADAAGLVPACSVSGTATASCLVPSIVIDKDDPTPTPNDPNDADGVDDQQTVIVNQDATFTITITNNGNEDLCNVVLTDIASDGSLNVMPCVPSFASIDTDNGAVAPGLGDGIFAVGDVESYTCTVTGVTQNFTNEIFVDAVGCTTGTPVDDDDPTEVIVNNVQPEIQIIKDDNDPSDFDDLQVSTDGTATFDIVITNTGTEDLCNVVLMDVPTDPAVNVTTCIPTFASIDTDNGAVAPGLGDGILAVGDVETYVCTVTGVTQNFTNEIFVDAVGCGSGIPVDDDDPTDVVLCDLEVMEIPFYQGEVGGVGPFYYNKLEVDIFNGTLPYTYEWDAIGYVRQAMINQDDNTAFPDGDREISIIYSDNAYWAVTITDHLGCQVFATNDPTATGEPQEVLDIWDFEMTGDNCHTRNIPEGTLTIYVEDGTPPYSYEWSGPVTWSPQVQTYPFGSGVPFTSDNGYPGEQFQLTELMYGWYSVTVTDSGIDDYNDPRYFENGNPIIDDDPNTPLPEQKTEGWYWIECERPSGRGKDMASGNASITSYPNPMTDAATIEFGIANSGVAKIELFSVDGQKMLNLFNGEIEGGQLNTMNFTAGPLSAGVYIIKLITPDGEEVMEKLIITNNR